MDGRENASRLPVSSVSRKPGNSMVVSSTTHEFGIRLIYGCHDGRQPLVDKGVHERMLHPPVLYRFGKASNGEVTERLKVHDWKSCVPLIRYRGFESPPLRHLERVHTTRYLKYPSLSNWSTMLVSMNEAGSAVAAFGVVPLIARRVFLIESALGLGFRSAHLAKIW